MLLTKANTSLIRRGTRSVISVILASLSLSLANGCNASVDTTSQYSTKMQDSMAAIVHDFLVTGLVHFHHDTMTHLYIGDPAIMAEANQRNDSLEDVIRTMEALRQRLSQLPPASDPRAQQRRRDLHDRIIAFETRGNILLGHFPESFDQETQRLFGVIAPHYEEDHFADLTAELEALVPGETPLAERLEAFREQFVIPPEKLETVISAAMAECRRLTLEHIDLPDNERVSLHIARNQPYVGFTYYKGDSHSEIHLNADIPVHIERAIELGCHEGYPGHHVHATLLERDIIKGLGWQEYSLVTLFGPIAVVAEGAASHTIDLVFSEQERFEFERDTLLPLAGLRSARLDDYYRYVKLVEALNFARNEAARRYLYDGANRAETIDWLVTYGLETRATASQRLDFIEAWRSYVVTYNTGRVRVRRYIEELAGDNRERQWDVFETILTTPVLPADM